MPKQLHCFCRKVDNGSFMILCDECGIWFHGACVGISDKKSKKFVEWHCFYCSRSKKFEEDVLQRMDRFQNECSVRIQLMSQELQDMKQNTDLEQENQTVIKGLQEKLERVQEEKANLITQVEDSEKKLRSYDNEKQIEIEGLLSQIGTLQEEKAKLEATLGVNKEFQDRVQEEKANLIAKLEEYDKKLRAYENEAKENQIKVEGLLSQIETNLTEKKEFQALQESGVGNHQINFEEQNQMEDLLSKIESLQEENTKLKATLDEKEKRLRKKSRLSLRKD